MTFTSSDPLISEQQEFNVQTPAASTSFTSSDPVITSFSTGDSVLDDVDIKYSDVEGFESQADAMTFVTWMGSSDTARGLVQLIPGDMGEEKMAKDFRRLEYALEKYGAPVMGAYMAGLVADPVGWALPISKLRIPVKAAELGLKYRKGKAAKDIAQVAAGSAVVGAAGYTPGEVGSEEFMEQKALQTGLGAVGGTALYGAGKGIKNLWSGGKNARYGQSEIPLSNVAERTGRSVDELKLMPEEELAKLYTPEEIAGRTNKTLGDKAWESYSSSPGKIGASIGAVGGGFAMYNSDLDYTIPGETTLQQLFAPEAGSDWYNWRNGIVGAIAGAAGMRKVVSKNPQFFIPKFGQSDTYQAAKASRKAEQAQIIEGKLMPVAAKLAKLSEKQRVVLHKMVVNDDIYQQPLAPGKLSPLEDLKKEMGLDSDYQAIEELIPLKKEVRDVIDELGKELVEQGFLDERVWLKNQDKYLSRLYRKENAVNAFMGTGGLKVIGRVLKARGDTKTVTKKQYVDWLDGVADVEGIPRASKHFNPNSDIARNEEYRWELWQQDEFDEAGNMLPKKNLDEMGDNDPIQIRRDYTPREREEMGEVVDILETFLHTGKMLANDVSAGRMLNKIAQTDSIGPAQAEALNRKAVTPMGAGKRVNTGTWEMVPQDKKKYGNLAGRYVRPELLYDMKHFNGDAGLSKLSNNQVWNTYRQFNAWWKGTKTVGNPATHMNNGVSNFMAYDFATADLGIGAEKYRYLASAFKELPISPKGDIILKEGTDFYEAYSRGVISSNMVEGELKGAAAAAFKSAHKRNAGLLEKGKASDLSAVRYASKVTQRLWETVGEPVLRKATDLYSWEDGVFRVATFKAFKDHYIAKGISPNVAMDLAAQRAQRSFVDYDNIPPALQYLRELPVPFASYMYGMVPRLAETAIRHPMKIAKWAAVAYTANEVGWLMSDSSDREEVERLMEAQSYGNDTMWGIPGMPSTKTKIPDFMNPFGEQGDMGFFDWSRMYAGGNVFDANEGQLGQVKILPGMAQPGFGFAGALYDAALGLDRFKGKEIPPGERLRFLVSQMVPNIPGIPGTYAQKKIDRALSGKDPALADKPTVLTAVLSAAGIKVNPVDINKLYGRLGASLNGKVNEFEKQIRSAWGQYNNGDISEAQAEEKVQQITKKMEEIINEYQRATSG